MTSAPSAAIVHRLVHCTIVHRPVRMIVLVRTDHKHVLRSLVHLAAKALVQTAAKALALRAATSAATTLAPAQVATTAVAVMTTPAMATKAVVVVADDLNLQR